MALLVVVFGIGGIGIVLSVLLSVLVLAVIGSISKNKISSFLKKPITDSNFLDREDL